MIGSWVCFVCGKWRNTYILKFLPGREWACGHGGKWGSGEEEGTVGFVWGAIKWWNVVRRKTPDAGCNSCTCEMGAADGVGVRVDELVGYYRWIDGLVMCSSIHVFVCASLLKGVSRYTLQCLGSCLKCCLSVRRSLSSCQLPTVIAGLVFCLIGSW